MQVVVHLCAVEPPDSNYGDSIADDGRGGQGKKLKIERRWREGGTGIGKEIVCYSRENVCLGRRKFGQFGERVASNFLDFLIHSTRSRPPRPSRSFAGFSLELRKSGRGKIVVLRMGAESERLQKSWGQGMRAGPALQAVARTASQMRSFTTFHVSGLSISGKSVDSASSK